MKPFCNGWVDSPLIHFKLTTTTRARLKSSNFSYDTPAASPAITWSEIPAKQSHWDDVSYLGLQTDGICREGASSWLRRGDDDGGGEWQASERTNGVCGQKRMKRLKAFPLSQLHPHHQLLVVMWALPPRSSLLNFTLELSVRKFPSQMLRDRSYFRPASSWGYLHPLLWLNGERFCLWARRTVCCCWFCCYNFIYNNGGVDCSTLWWLVGSSKRSRSSAPSDVTIFPHPLLIICVSNSKLHQQHPHQTRDRERRRRSTGSTS